LGSFATGESSFTNQFNLGGVKRYLPSAGTGFEGLKIAVRRSTEYATYQQTGTEAAFFTKYGV
jgi:hypothetical protein